MGMGREPGFDARRAESFQSRLIGGPMYRGAPSRPERGTSSPGLSAQAPRVRMPALTEAHLKSFIFIGAIALLATAAAHAQTLVDPNKVAPEYREAAEKRRAEQLRQRECALKADLEKVLPRDRTAFLNHCLETMAAKQ